MSSYMNKEQRRAWLQERRQGIGASDAAVILGLSPWKSALALFAEKAGLVDTDDRELTEYQKWGHRLEDAVATGYGEETGRHVIKPANPFAISRHPEVGFMQATLDRRQQLVDGCEMPSKFVVTAGHTQGVLECKTTAFHKGDEWEEEAPLLYQVQVQHQMFAANFTWGSLAVLIGGNRFKYDDLQRNDAFLRYLVQRCQEFWDRVQSGNAPPADGHEATRAALHRMFPRETDPEPVLLPDDSIAWDEARVAGKAKLDEAQAEIDLAENRLKQALGDHVAGVTPSGITYTWKATPKKSYMVAASEPRVLRRKEPKGK